MRGRTNAGRELVWQLIRPYAAKSVAPGISKVVVIMAAAASNARRLMSTFADRAVHVPRSGIREIMDAAWSLGRRGAKVIHLEVGQPNFATPRHVVEATKTYLEQGHTKYVCVFVCAGVALTAHPSKTGSCQAWRC